MAHFETSICPLLVNNKARCLVSIIIKQLKLELSGYNWFCLVGQTLSQSRYRLDTTKVEIVQTDRQTYGWMDTRQRMEGHKTLDGGIYRWCMDGGGMVKGQ